MTDVGTWYDPPKFEAVGIDIVRSDRAEITTEVATDVLQIILNVDDENDARTEVYDTISDTVDDIRSGNISNEKIGRPKGMGQPPDEYGTTSRTPQPTYRGAKYANRHFDWENMDSGVKPYLFYIERVGGDWSATYTAETAEDGNMVDAVAVENPSQLPDEFEIDYTTMIDKTLKNPLDPILHAMGWSFDESVMEGEQGRLSSYM